MAALTNVAGATTETVTNAGTAFLQVARFGVRGQTAVQATVTKTSGTLAGTMTLQGSLDGVNYKAMTVADASTAIPTYTVTDVASQTYIWRLNGNPYPFYRVSWTGTGTMIGTFTAVILQQ